MSQTSFISTASAKSNNDDEILGDQWFPAVSKSEFERVYRITGSVQFERQLHYLQQALHEVCIELQTLKTDNVDVSSFYDIETTYIGDTTANELDFKTAVYALAKSKSSEQYRDFDTTASGHDRADSVDQSVDKFLRQSREAIRRLLGKSRISVALI